MWQNSRCTLAGYKNDSLRGLVTLADPPRWCLFNYSWHPLAIDLHLAVNSSNIGPGHKEKQTGIAWRLGSTRIGKLGPRSTKPAADSFECVLDRLIRLSRCIVLGLLSFKDTRKFTKQSSHPPSGSICHVPIQANAQTTAQPLTLCWSWLMRDEAGVEGKLSKTWAPGELVCGKTCAEKKPSCCTRRWRGWWVGWKNSVSTEKTLFACQNQILRSTSRREVFLCDVQTQKDLIRHLTLSYP